MQRNAAKDPIANAYSYSVDGTRSLLQLAACLKTAEVRLDNGCSIGRQLLLLAHQITTNARLDLDGTFVLGRIGGGVVAQSLGANFVGAARRRCCAANGGGGGHRRARRILHLFAHSIAAEVGLNLGGSVFLRNGGIRRAGMNVHRRAEQWVSHIHAHRQHTQKKPQENCVEQTSRAHFSREIGRLFKAIKFIDTLLTINSNEIERARAFQ